MTALAKDRNTKAKYVERTRYIPVADDAIIYLGANVAMNPAGYAIPADKTTEGAVVVGVSEEFIDNTGGAAGAVSIRVEVGVFGFVNDANAVTAADIGRPCYVVDDQTVADETEGSATVAGIVDSIDSSGVVWVRHLDASPLPVSGIETVSADGAISVYTRTTLLSVTGTRAYTLADGRYEGQRKTLRCILAATSPIGVVTPANFSDGATMTFNALEDTVELEWHKATGWVLALNVAVAVA